MATDTEIITAIRHLITAEEAGTYQPQVISLGPFGSFTLVCALQVAHCHPAAGPMQKNVLQQLGRPLAAMFGPPLREVLDAGWDTAQDIPWFPAGA